MNKDQILLDFKELNSKDPLIKVEKNTIIIQPFYFYFSFVMHFVCIFILSIMLIKGNEFIVNLFSYFLIGILAFNIILELRYFNTTKFNLLQKEILILPHVLWKNKFKPKVLKFAEINNVIVKSNFSSTGFWMIHRRYYIIIQTIYATEIIIISSNENEIAIQICKNINLMLL